MSTRRTYKPERSISQVLGSLYEPLTTCEYLMACGHSEFRLGRMSDYVAANMLNDRGQVVAGAECAQCREKTLAEYKAAHTFYHPFVKLED